MTEPSESGSHRWLAAVLLLVVLAYLPTFSAAWVWDDHRVLEDNPTLGQLDVLLVSSVRKRRSECRPIRIRSPWPSVCSTTVASLTKVPAREPRSRRT